jgi:hypothetical protein
MPASFNEINVRDRHENAREGPYIKITIWPGDFYIEESTGPNIGLKIAKLLS